MAEKRKRKKAGKGKKPEMKEKSEKRKKPGEKKPAEKKVQLKKAKPAKAGVKREKKPAKAVHKKLPKPAEKKPGKKKPRKISKSKEVKRLSRLIRAKQRRMFRGRFGKRSIRRVSKSKWQRWRKPRGIDIYFKREDGRVPGIGYRTAKEIRFVHPSGFRERLVRNMQELLAVEGEREMIAARISGKVGKKKKAEMLRKADELKIWVLNR